MPGCLLQRVHRREGLDGLSSVNAVLAGRGGQGVLLLTRLLATAAALAGRPVMVSETHGMSRRGGSVVCHLKLGDSRSPLIRRGTADCLVGLELHETLRNLPFLRRGAVLLTNSEQPLPAEVEPVLHLVDIRAHRLPASQMADALGSRAVANVVMAGFAGRHLSLEAESLSQALENLVRGNLHLNRQALEAGLAAGQ